MSLLWVLGIEWDQYLWNFRFAHMWIGARDGSICSHKYRSELPEKMRLPDSRKGIFYVERELRKVTLFSKYMDTKRDGTHNQG